MAESLNNPSVYDPSKDLNKNMTCTDKSLNPVYVYNESKDVELKTVDVSTLNEEDTDITLS